MIDFFVQNLLQHGFGAISHGPNDAVRSENALSVTILGCASSGGVPRVGQGWGKCDPGNPRNRRRRCSILIAAGAGEARTNILVDTSPDLREQLIDAGVKRLDAVLYTPPTPTTRMALTICVASC